MPPSGPLVRIALRNLGRNRRRSVLTAATVAIGVAAILFSRAYIDGLQALILDFVIEARDGALRVERTSYAASQDLAPLDRDLAVDPALEARLRGVPEVRALSPRLRFRGFISNGAASTLFDGVAIDPARDASVCPRGPGAAHGVRDGGGLVAGPGFRGEGGDVVILGDDLAASMKLRVGDAVTLLVETRAGSTDTVDLVVAGRYRFPDPADNKHLAVVPLAVAQRLLHMPGRATGYVVGVAAPRDVPAASAHLRAALAGREPALAVRTWADLAPYYRDVLSLQRDVLDVIVLIVFALVLGGVVNTMLMSVFERTREIGTLMSIGFRRRQIVRLFLLESALLSGLAALVGAALGLVVVAAAHRRGIAFYIPAVGEVLNRPVLAPLHVLFACVGALVGGVVGGLLPAYRASRMRPVEALRVT